MSLALEMVIIFPSRNIQQDVAAISCNQNLEHLAHLPEPNEMQKLLQTNHNHKNVLAVEQTSHLRLKNHSSQLFLYIFASTVHSKTLSEQ